MDASNSVARTHLPDSEPQGTASSAPRKFLWHRQTLAPWHAHLACDESCPCAADNHSGFSAAENTGDALNFSERAFSASCSAAPINGPRPGAAPSASKTFSGGSSSCVLALAFLFLTPPSIPDYSEFVTVPFRTAQSMILVDARVNGKPVTLLLDTGAINTIVSAKAYGIPQFQLRDLRHRNNQDPGLTGDSLRLRANLAFANRVWISQPVSVMNVDELTRRFGTPVDGILGQDLLQEFRSVRINYKAHVIELEQ
jgi:aspartyl protease